MANGKITGPELIADDVFVRLAKLDDALAGLVLQMGKIETAAKSALNTGQLNTQATRANRVNREALDIIREQDRLEKQLIRTKQRNELATESTARALQRERVELQAVNRDIKRQATANSELVGAYRRLSAQLLIAKDRYKDLAIEQGANSVAARRAAAEVERLQRRVRSADQAVGDFQRNVGNYASGFAPLINIGRQLVGAFGIVEGLRLGVRFLRESVELAREAKGVEFAFNNIGDAGVEAFERIKASTRGLLSDLEIRRAIVEFDNFALSAEQLDTVLEFVTLRATQTGQSFQFLRNSAIEAITKESVLRADNLGLSQARLNEELEKGVDFLTAFTNIAQFELDRAGGILDEAANSAQQFDAAFENLSVEIGNVLTNIKGFQVFTDLINLGVSNTKLWNELLIQNGDILGFLESVYNSTTATGRAQNAVLLSEIENRKAVAKAVQEQIDKAIELQGVYGPLTEEQSRDISGEGGSIFTNPGKGREVAKSIGQINEEIKRQQGLLDGATTRAQAKAIQDTIAELEKQRDALLGVIDAEEKRTQAVNGSIAFYENFVRQQEELRDSTARTAEEYDAFSRSIEEAKGKILELQGAFRDTELVFQQEKFSLNDLFEQDDTLEIAQDVDRFLNTEGVRQGMENLARALGEDQADLIAEFEQGYERDYQNFLKYSKLKLELAAEEKQERLRLADDVVQGIGEFGAALFEIAEQRAQREVDIQNEAFDAIINSKNATEEQIAIAEKKREENEKRYAKEREKRQRQEFLLNQAIEVGRIFIADALARANATATSFTLPPGVAQGYLATALGLISTQTGIALATVLAQTLPAFFTGKSLMDNYEGLATWGERGREVRVTKGGGVEVSPDTTTPTFVRRDDMIVRSIPLFQQAMANPNSEVFKRVAGAWSKDTAGRTQGVSAAPGYNPAILEASIHRGLRRGFKGVKNQINIINRLDPQPRVRRY